MLIRVKYRSPETKRLKSISVGNWIDLTCDEDTSLRAGQSSLIPLGIAMQLPEGYEANIVPRSSTFMKYKILQTNSFGVIDTSYCGDNDWWMFGAFATEDTSIKRGDRICQFRINVVQPQMEFVEVESLGNRDRGGFGSTGTS